MVFQVNMLLYVFNVFCLYGILKSEVIYVTKSDDVTINCPFKSENDYIQWLGPPNLTTYIDKGNINSNVEGIGVIGNSAAGEYNLIIYGFEESNQGEYQCSTVIDRMPSMKNFIVMLQINPLRVTLTGRNYSDTESVRSIDCVADGNPSLYRYQEWEHSYYGQHIRYLKGFENGTLVLPNIDKTEYRHEDSGSYRCLVGNGIPKNNSYQSAEIFIQTTGPPVFLRQNSETHYGKYGHSINIQFFIYSVPEVARVEIVIPTMQTNHDIIEHGTEKKNVTDVFHNKMVLLLAYVVTLRIPVIDLDDYFTNYTIEAENRIGNSCFTFRIIENTCCDASSSMHLDLTVFILIGLVLFLIILTPVGYMWYKSGNLPRRLIHSENSNSGQEEGPAAFNNIYGMNETQQPICSGAVAASVIYSNISRDEVLNADRLTCGPLTRQDMPLNQPSVNQELSELNYIEIELNHIPEGHRFHIHGQDNKTEYSEIEFGVIGDPLPSSESEMDDNNDTDTIDCMVVKD